MKSPKTTQTMKPATAAKKLGIHLLAAPAEFQEGVVSRDELNALQADPPAWLRDLRSNGPHPRSLTASRLDVSVAGLARGGVTEALTTEQIEALKADPPEWLQQERATHGKFRREAAHIKELAEQKRLKEQRQLKEEQEQQKVQQKKQQQAENRPAQQRVLAGRRTQVATGGARQYVARKYGASR